MTLFLKKNLLIYLVVSGSSLWHERSSVPVHGLLSSCGL